jgi:phosphoglycolate phosphatase
MKINSRGRSSPELYSECAAASRSVTTPRAAHRIESENTERMTKESATERPTTSPKSPHATHTERPGVHPVAQDSPCLDDVRVLVFDLDGTLIDSKLDLVLAVNATLEYMGRPRIPNDDVGKFVGGGAALLVRRVLGADATDEEAATGLEHFLEYYRTHMLDNTAPYPGVREGLEQLKDHPMAILTNKPVRFSEGILNGLGLSRYFRYVYGGNSFESKKPDPFGMNVLLRDFGVAPRQAILVGDSDVDVKTARNAGSWACGVSYGFLPESFRACPPDIMVDSLEHLAAHVNGGPNVPVNIPPAARSEK